MDTTPTLLTSATAEPSAGATGYPIAHRSAKPDGRTIVEVGSARFGSSDVVAVAGPCAVESLAQMRSVARAARELSLPVIRAGAFKPRTSPYAFQGLGYEALGILAQIRREFGIAVVTEVVAVDQVTAVARSVDMLQIGTRNMSNVPLLQAAAGSGLPILLKRGMQATVDETLLAAEYILASGNPNVVLCERGIRGFDPATRNVFDLAGLALLRQRTHLPVIADPSHATGIRTLVAPVAIGAVAAGADGVIVEAHPQPERALCDGAQSLDLAQLADLVAALAPAAAVAGRGLCRQTPELAVVS